MSRKIKFRAWDKEYKEYNHESPIALSLEGELYAVWAYHPQKITSKRYIIEQYTGLKDKNGKKIYEGDIVEYDWYIIGDKPAYRVKKQVVFDDMGARVGNDRIRNCSNVKVVGNIHENKELLELQNEV